MLVLTRKKGESIMVGDNIEVKVLDIHAGQVKIGLQAPHDIPVHRKEIYEVIQRETRAAAASGAGFQPSKGGQSPRSAEDISKIFREVRTNENSPQQENQ